MVEEFPSWAGFQIEPQFSSFSLEIGSTKDIQYSIRVRDGYSGNAVIKICIDPNESYPDRYPATFEIPEMGWDTNNDGAIDKFIHRAVLARVGAVIDPESPNFYFKMRVTSLSPPTWIDPSEYYYAAIHLLPRPPDPGYPIPFPPGFCRSGPMAWIQLIYDWNSSDAVLVVIGNNLQFPLKVPINGAPDLMPRPRTCTLRNMGTKSLRINPPLGHDPFFATPDRPLPVDLGQGESIDVEFRPSVPGEWKRLAMLIERAPIPPSDPPPIGDDRILCSGTARYANIGLECSPRLVDFGTVMESGPKPIPRPRFVTVRNYSEDDLEIECQIHDSTGISSVFSWMPSGDRYQIANGTLTATIPFVPASPPQVVRDGLDLRVGFTPNAPGEYGMSDDIRIVVNGKLARSSHITTVDDSVKLRGIWKKVKPLLWLSIRQAGWVSFCRQPVGLSVGIPSDKYPFDGTVFADPMMRADVNLSYEIKPSESHIAGDTTMVTKDIGKVKRPYPKPFSFPIEIPADIKNLYPSMEWNCVAFAKTDGRSRASATCKFQVYVE